MKNTLIKLKKIVEVLYKLLPVLIELLEDFADDGKINKSNSKRSFNATTGKSTTSFGK